MLSLCFSSPWQTLCYKEIRSVCKLLSSFVVVVIYVYIKRNNVTDLRSAQRATSVKGFVYYEYSRWTFPPSTHTPFHSFSAALWPITAPPVLSAIQNARRLKFMLVFSFCPLSSSGNICIVAVKLLNSCEASHLN